LIYQARIRRIPAALNSTRLFVEIAKRSFQRQISYRTAALAGLATNFFFGMLRVMVLLALYGQRQEVAGISVQGAVTFTGLTQAVIGFLSMFSWYELMNTIYSGDVANDLLKPVDFYEFWLANDFGRAMAQLVLRGLPMMVAYALIFGITTPQTAWQWTALAAALFLAWLLSFSWRFIVNLAAFWIPNAVGIGRFVFALSWFLSGFMMPLRYFPDWFVRLSYLTPFPSTINSVVEIYLGVLTPAGMVKALLVQVAWIVGLFAAGQLVLRTGMRKLVIQGG
jgi:ABC-2 type transport system permease protein